MKISHAVAVLLLSAAPALAQTPPPSDPAVQAGEQMGGTQDMSVADIEDKDVYGSDGEEIAGIDNVVIGPDKKVHAVIEFGGFLGLGQEHRLVPLDQFTLEGDRLVLTGKTEDDLKNLPAWDSDLEGFSELEQTYMAPVKLSATTSPAETPATTTQPNVRSEDEPKPVEPDTNAASPDASPDAPTPATPAPANPTP